MIRCYQLTMRLTVFKYNTVLQEILPRIWTFYGSLVEGKDWAFLLIYVHSLSTEMLPCRCRNIDGQMFITTKYEIEQRFCASVRAAACVENIRGLLRAKSHRSYNIYWSLWDKTDQVQVTKLVCCEHWNFYTKDGWHYSHGMCSRFMTLQLVTVLRQTNQSVSTALTDQATGWTTEGFWFDSSQKQRFSSSPKHPHKLWPPSSGHLIIFPRR